MNLVDYLSKLLKNCFVYVNLCSVCKEKLVGHNWKNQIPISIASLLIALAIHIVNIIGLHILRPFD